MSWLRIDDGFPEHEKMLALSVGAKWLHVVALCQCASNLTNGYIDPVRLKVICAIADVPRPAACIKQLVEAGLWIERVGGGYDVKDYLEYNPSAETVKAEQAKARERMQDLRKRRSGSEERSGEHSDERAGEVRLPRPVQSPEEDQKHRPVEDKSSGNLETLAYAHALRLFAAIRDDHKDDHTRQVVLSYSHKLPPAAFERVREELLEGERTIKHQGRWVNSRLAKLTEERQVA